jgi:SAM-dependent methyltransferase
MQGTLLTQYNQIGEEYIAGQARFFSSLPDATVEFIDSSLPNLVDKRLLDVGCGQGKDLARYKNLGAMIYGIDTSDFMVKQAKGMLNTAPIELGSIENTQFESNFFDVVTARYSLHYLATFEKAYREIARILKPGGWLVLVVPHPLRDFMLQKKKAWGEKEILEVALYDGEVTVQYPTHTFAEYISPDFLAGFQLVHFQEGAQSDEYAEDTAGSPGFLGIVATKLPI